MGEIKNIVNRGKEFKLEIITEKEIEKISKICNGNYKSQQARWFILTTKDNIYPFIELIKNNEINKYCIGQAGVIIQNINSKKTGEYLLTGPDLVDLYVKENHRGEGLAQVLSLERFKYLKDKGWDKAYFTDEKINQDVKRVFDTLMKKNKIDYSIKEISKEDYLYEITIK